MRAGGVGGGNRTHIGRLTVASSTFELHRQSGARVAPPPYRFSVVIERWVPPGSPAWRRPRPRASWRRAEGARAPPYPPPGSGRSGGRACLPEGRRRPSSWRRAGGVSSPAARLAGKAREGRARARCTRGTGGRNRTYIGGVRVRCPAVGLLRYVCLRGPGGSRTPLRRVRTGYSTVERRVRAKRGRPEGTRTPMVPLKRRLLSL